MLVHRVQAPSYDLRIYKFTDVFLVDPTSYLTNKELTYLNSITSSKRRNEFSQSRLTLKQVLAEELNLLDLKIPFTEIGEGKPIISGVQDFDFNMSHSKDFFAIVTSRTYQVGVDIENIRSPSHLLEIAEKFFTEQEKSKLRNAVDAEEQLHLFARLWSGKEAIIKAQGGGVFKHVLGISIDASNGTIYRLPAEYGEPKKWSLEFIETIPNYMCALALKK